MCEVYCFCNFVVIYQNGYASYVPLATSRLPRPTCHSGRICTRPTCYVPFATPHLSFWKNLYTPHLPRPFATPHLSFWKNLYTPRLPRPKTWFGKRGVYRFLQNDKWGVACGAWQVGRVQILPE